MTKTSSKNRDIHSNVSEWLDKMADPIDAEFELYMMKSDEEVNEDLIAMGEKPGDLKKKVMKMIQKERLKQKANVLFDKVITWVSDLWQPIGAGEFALTTASSDMPIQEKTFEFEYEENVEIEECYWEVGNKENKELACLRFKWTAPTPINNELWIRFFDPQTKHQYSEICLGSKTEGNVDLLEEVLNFNPATQKWAMSLLFVK